MLLLYFLFLVILYSEEKRAACFWVLKISSNFNTKHCKLGLVNTFELVKLDLFGTLNSLIPHRCNCCVCCSFKEPVVFDQSMLLRFGSTRSQFAGRTLYQSRIWSSTHERAAPAFERTLSSRSLTSRSLNSSMFTSNTVCQKLTADINICEP